MTKILNFFSNIKYYILIGFVILGAFVFWGYHNKGIGYEECKKDQAIIIQTLRKEHDNELNILYRQNLELNEKLKNNQKVQVYIKQEIPEEIKKCINTNSCFSAQ